LRATEDLVALRIAKDTLLQLIEKDARMAAGLLRVVSRNLVDVLNGRSYRSASKPQAAAAE
jgi:CRP-like cAMP-binding protein